MPGGILSASSRAAASVSSVSPSRLRSATDTLPTLTTFRSRPTPPTVTRWVLPLLLFMLVRGSLPAAASVPHPVNDSARSVRHVDFSAVKRAFASMMPHFGPVWRLSVPVILTNALQSVVNLASIFMAGRLGPVEIAAVGMANSVNMLVLVAFMSITAGSMTLAAQARGARDDSELSRVARQSLSLGVVMWLVLGSAGLLFAQPLLEFLNGGAGDPTAVELGTGYLQIMFVGIIFLVMNLTVNSLMQGAGDTVTPLYISIGMNILTVLLNWVFMFGPGPFPAMGVPGAALGIVVSRAVAAGAGILIMASGRNNVRLGRGNYLPDWQAFREILAIG